MAPEEEHSEHFCQALQVQGLQHGKCLVGLLQWRHEGPRPHLDEASPNAVEEDEHGFPGSSPYRGGTTALGRLVATVHHVSVGPRERPAQLGHSASSPGYREESTQGKHRQCKKEPKHQKQKQHCNKEPKHQKQGQRCNNKGAKH
ncbi:unnamed protein product [Durusdinium trenchii]|uniref:Uncharacterized protein n=1 Tax=Durusdinium trenchii TaxID=1381693 RepID=A0ABP0HHF4_9DINO